MNNRETFKVYLLAIFACILWSTAFVGIKIGLKYISPLLFAGIRFFISGLILIPFAGNIKKYFRNFKIHFKTIFIISLLQTFLLYALFYTGMTLVPSAIAAIIVGSSPLITAISTHLFLKDDKLNIFKLITLLIGVVGIIIIILSRNPITSKGKIEFLGIGILLLASFTSAIGNIFISKQKKSINPIFLNSAQIGLGGILLILLSIPIERFNKFHLNFEFVGVLIWLSLLSAVAFSIWFYLLQKPGLKVSKLNVWKFIIPIFGAILSWIILKNENPELLTISGMIIVSISIFLYYYPNKRNRNSR